MIISKAFRFAILTGLGSLVVLCRVSAQETEAEPPSVLIVTAHPDDEALFAGLVYRLAVELGSRVELAVVTDGAGGYRYSTLAEPLYGLDLTDPDVAREYLPAIRKRELLAGGKIVGIRDFHFLDQPDTGYTQDPDSILAEVWDGDLVLRQLEEIMRGGDFDFVLTHLPLPSAHGHHKSASILAIRAAARLGADRPTVLGAWISNTTDAEPTSFRALDGYADTRTQTATPQWRFDRTRTFGLNDRLNYKIVVNWLIAEHKSQGTMQMLMGAGDVETFWVYENNAPDAAERTARLFDFVNGAK